MRHRRKVPRRVVVPVRLTREDLAKLRYRSLRALLGDDHPETLAAVRAMAGELAASPEGLDEAVETYMTLLRHLWQHAGPRDGRYLATTLEAAGVVLRGGDRTRAAQMFREVLDTRRTLSGPDHPEAVRARRALAGLGEAEQRPEPSAVRGLLRRTGHAADLARGGDLDGAAAEFADIVDRCELALGHRDARTLASRAHLAATLFKQGHLDRAEELYRRIVEDQPDDADGAAHNDLGTVLFHLGRTEEAEPILREAVRRHRRASGTGDAQTTRAVENLARALVGLGHRAEARALSEEYLRIRSHDHPPGTTGPRRSAGCWPDPEPGRPRYAAAMGTIDWLLDADPAIRWQVLRDLADAPPDEVAAERARVERDGWGARLLDLQGPDGLWDGGALFPADHRDGEPGQPWTTTMHTLQTLQILGLDPACERARRAVALVAANATWENAGQRYFDGEVEPCINGRTIEAGAYFGIDVAPIVERVLRERLADGGWNCEAEFGSVRSSFDTTLSVLDGLLAHERATGRSNALSTARLSGEEYLLERHLFRRRSTGGVVAEAYLDLAFPYYWHYDVLRALDYFRRAGTPRDPRMAEAVDLVRAKRGPDGRWPLDRVHPGRVHLALDGEVGAPSRWNTLRALRVLRWWES